MQCVAALLLALTPQAWAYATQNHITQNIRGAVAEAEEQPAWLDWLPTLGATADQKEDKKVYATQNDVTQPIQAYAIQNHAATPGTPGCPPGLCYILHPEPCCTDCTQNTHAAVAAPEHLLEHLMPLEAPGVSPAPAFAASPASAPKTVAAGAPAAPAAKIKAAGASAAPAAIKKAAGAPPAPAVVILGAPAAPAAAAAAAPVAAAAAAPAA